LEEQAALRGERPFHRLPGPTDPFLPTVEQEVGWSSMTWRKA
jgi:hypothetical protein